MAHHDRIVAAVVHLPVMGLLHAATETGPATLNGAPIHVSDAPLADADVLMTKAAMDPSFWKDGQPPEVKRSFRPSLAWRLCLVAEGRFDAMVSLRMAWEWDTAAGSLIAERAGAAATTMKGRKLRFNNPTPKQDGLVIAGPALTPNSWRVWRPARAPPSEQRRQIGVGIPAARLGRHDGRAGPAKPRDLFRQHGDRDRSRPRHRIRLVLVDRHGNVETRVWCEPAPPPSAETKKRSFRWKYPSFSASAFSTRTSSRCCWGGEGKGQGSGARRKRPKFQIFRGRA